MESREYSDHLGSKTVTKKKMREEECKLALVQNLETKHGCDVMTFQKLFRKEDEKNCAFGAKIS